MAFARFVHAEQERRADSAEVPEAQLPKPKNPPTPALLKLLAAASADAFQERQVVLGEADPELHAREEERRRLEELYLGLSDSGESDGEGNSNRISRDLDGVSTSGASSMRQPLQRRKLFVHEGSDPEDDLIAAMAETACMSSSSSDNDHWAEKSHPRGSGAAHRQQQAADAEHRWPSAAPPSADARRQGDKLAAHLVPGIASPHSTSNWRDYYCRVRPQELQDRQRDRHRARAAQRRQAQAESFNSKPQLGAGSADAAAVPPKPLPKSKASKTNDVMRKLEALYQKDMKEGPAAGTPLSNLHPPQAE